MVNKDDEMKGCAWNWKWVHDWEAWAPQFWPWRLSSQTSAQYFYSD